MKFNLQIPILFKLQGAHVDVMETLYKVSTIFKNITASNFNLH